MKARNNTSKNYSLWLQKVSSLGIVTIFIFTLLSGIKLFTTGSNKYHIKSHTGKNISLKDNKKDKIKDKTKNKDSEIHSNDNMNLNIKFAEGIGRTNPFIPVSPIPQAQIGQPIVGPGNIPYQVPVSSVTQPQILFPAQLPPLPDQKTPEKPPSIEVPAWPTHSPILTAGPPERLASMLKLRTTGIVEERDGRKFAVVEETVENYDPRTGTRDQQVRSHVVREGSTITEYRLTVKKIDKNIVVLTRGNQRIDLYLKDQPQILTAPPTLQQAKDITTEVVPASEAK